MSRNEEVDVRVGRGLTRSVGPEKDDPGWLEAPDNLVRVADNFVCCDHLMDRIRERQLK
jgi:hypothetical protein